MPSAEAGYDWLSVTEKETAPCPAGHPVTVSTPSAALGLFGLLSSDGKGLDRLQPQSPDNLAQAASILEYGVPVEATELPAWESAPFGAYAHSTAP
jgi:hypothetical protein